MVEVSRCDQNQLGTVYFRDASVKVLACLMLRKKSISAFVRSPSFGTEKWRSSKKHRISLIWKGPTKDH